MGISQHQNEDAQIRESIKKELGALFKGFYVGSQQYKRFSQYHDSFIGKLLKGIDVVENLSSLLHFLEAESNLSTTFHVRAIRIMQATTYLSFVETLGDSYVNLAILLLTAKGVDFHLEPDYDHRYTRHANSLDELESPSIPLLTKLDFLKLNGLTFFSKMIDRNLRNCIAHMNFEIEDNGDFFILGRGKRKKVDLTEKHETFIECLSVVQSIFLEQLKRTGLA